VAEAYRPLPLPDRVWQGAPAALAGAGDFRRRMASRHTVRDFAADPVDEAVIREAIAAACGAPSGANRQPWFFAAIADPAMKARIRAAAEDEERAFYQGGAGDEWLAALEPIGTDARKPHLEVAPWLIVVFAQRWGLAPGGGRVKHYYVPESVGIATGFLIAALHHAGLSCLTHTPNPMGFLNAMLGRGPNEKPVMIVACGIAAPEATVPAVAKVKKPEAEVMAVWR
jgi:nitroreductase